MNLAERAFASTAVLLARLGLVDERRGRAIAALAWPRIVTGLARTSQRTADVVMVGIAIGPAGIAGMGFAFAYWGISIGVGYSLANGGMTFLSQRFGADDRPGLDLVFKQLLWIELFFAFCFTVLYVWAAEPLIALLGASPAALSYGTIYLQFVVLGLVFEVAGQVAERTLVSANEAWAPMVIRAGGAVLNVVLNAVFIFGLGLGVLGAALGTVLAAAGISLVLVVGLLRGRLPYFGRLPVQISLGRPYVDVARTKQIAEVAAPVVGRQFVSRGSHFLMLAIVASFGTVVVAAYVAAREVRAVMDAPGWGFGTAARSLVGQALGRDDEAEAVAYGWDLLRFTEAVYVFTALLMFVFAGQLATAFVEDPAAVATTVSFLLVMAVSLLGIGVDEAAASVIAAGGDTRWPLYGRLVGLYVFMVPIAYLGTVTPLGIVALYVAILAETVVPAVISFARFNAGTWVAVSRRYR